MKKLLIAFLLTSSLCFGMTGDSPFDPGAVRKTDQAARVDTINASFTGDIDVTGDVGAAALCAGPAGAPWASGGLAHLSAEKLAAYTVINAKNYKASAGAGGGMLVLGRLAGPTVSSNVTTENSDSLALISFEGVNGSNLPVGAAYIQSFQIGAAGANYIGGDMQFFTATSIAAPALRMRITPNGNMLIGSPPDPDDNISKLQIKGAAKLIAIATPTTPLAGQIFYSSADNSFYGYNGTEWKKLDN